MLNRASQNFNIQKYIALSSIVLFFVKLLAWFLTHSVSILTDALESIVNVIAGLIGLYSLYISGKPKDLDHPYGHGKVELISAAFEGVLIAFAGFIIIIEAISNLFHPHNIQRLDYGIYLVAITAAINYFSGFYCLKIGKKNNSLALIASGKHLMTDTYTTLGIISGLIMIYLTGINWIDSVVAILFAFIILQTGYKIVRSSIAGIMDEADLELINKMISLLNQNRSANWIDLHNLRIIKNGSMIHVDCHLTVPWYFNVHEAHHEIDKLTTLVTTHFGDAVEFFVHSDGCLEFSCAICDKSDCKVRKHSFEKKIEWNINNILSNKKHQIDL
ncbi:MAG: cation diffusion facilitator family transporter [Bacteroidota bacterium]